MSVPKQVTFPEKSWREQFIAAHSNLLKPAPFPPVPNTPTGC